MEYKIISSGSKGNAVIIGNVLVDCGVAFKYLKEHLYDVQFLFITHIHSDHVKESTLKNIVLMFPHIKIFGNYEVCQVFDEYPITAVNEDVPFWVGDGWGRVLPFRCPHGNVLCYGYVWDYKGKTIIYATDVETMEHAPKLKYDYFFLESNHDEAKVKRYLAQGSTGMRNYYNSKRHLSTHDAKTFFYLNRRDSNAVWVELHKSERNY